MGGCWSLNSNDNIKEYFSFTGRFFKENHIENNQENLKGNISIKEEDNKKVIEIKGIIKNKNKSENFCIHFKVSSKTDNDCFLLKNKKKNTVNNIFNFYFDFDFDFFAHFGDEEIIVKLHFYNLFLLLFHS